MNDNLDATARLIPVEVLLGFMRRYQAMREAQRTYFADRDRDNLAQVRVMERKLDAEARELILRFDEQERLQKTLFG